MKKIYITLIAIVGLIVLSQLAVSAIPEITVKETELVNIKLIAVDVDGDELDYSYSPPLNKSGQWQTGYGDYGEYIVNVSASDGKTKTTQKFKLVVEKVNWPPEVDEIKDMEIDEGSSIELEVKARDEEGDALTVEISEPFGDDGRWTPSFEDAGEYPIEVIVSDGTHSIIKNFNIKVNNVNRAPVIEAHSPTEEDIEMKEGESVSFIVSASDADGEELTYTWELDCEEQQVDKTSYCKTITKSDDDMCTEDEEIEVCEEGRDDVKEFRYYADYDSAGHHQVKVLIEDEEDTIVQKWEIDVENVNRPPKMDSFEDIEIDENETITIDINATDPDGDRVLYTISEPIGDDKEWTPGFDDAGKYPVNVTVSDGDLRIMRSFTITVNDVDRAPYFDVVRDITINETDKVIINLNSEDPDGDEVTYTAEGLPENAYLENNTITYQSTYETVVKPKTWYVEVLKFFNLDDVFYSKKKYDITLHAKGKDKESTQALDLVVKNRNRAPIIIPIADIYANETDIIKVNPKVVEYDNDKVSFTLSDPVKTGTWKTDYDSSGQYNVEVTAFDGKIKTRSNFTIFISNLNRPPTLESDPKVIVDENETAKISTKISDLDWEPTELAIVDGPEGSELVNNTFEWTPGYDVASKGTSKDVPITLSLTDVEGAVAYSDSLVVVNDVNRAPIIYNVSPVKRATILEGSSILFVPLSIDPDKDNLTYEWKDGVKVISTAPYMRRTFVNPGNKQITYRVTDGGEITKRYTWDIEVLDRPEPIKAQPTRAVTKTPVRIPVQRSPRTVSYTIEEGTDKPVTPVASDGKVNTELVEVYSYSSEEVSPVPAHMQQINIG